MIELHKKLGTFTKVEGEKRTKYIPNDPDLIVDVIIDHLLLVSPTKGRTKKEEMDIISTYSVRFRELCQTSFEIIMQENRGATSMERRKAGMEEPTPDDIQQSGEIYQACDICIALFSPFKTQLKSYRGYRITDDGNRHGLQDVCRSLILLKNRYGTANRIILTAFKGDVGMFLPLPGAEEIEYDNYFSWREKEQKDTAVKDTEERDSKKITYSF